MRYPCLSSRMLGYAKSVRRGWVIIVWYAGSASRYGTLHSCRWPTHAPKPSSAHRPRTWSKKKIKNTIRIVDPLVVWECELGEATYQGVRCNWTAYVWHRAHWLSILMSTPSPFHYLILKYSVESQGILSPFEGSFTLSILLKIAVAETPDLVQLICHLFNFF